MDYASICKDKKGIGEHVEEFFREVIVCFTQYQLFLRFVMFKAGKDKFFLGCNTLSFHRLKL